MIFYPVLVIRIGSYKKLLKDYPETEAKLWRRLNDAKSEELPVREDVSISEIFSMLDYTAYFDMTGTPNPTDSESILHYLIEDKIISKQDNGLYTITNLGALLFAKRIEFFPLLERKMIRVVQYEDDSMLNILKQDIGIKVMQHDLKGLLNI